MEEGWKKGGAWVGNKGVWGWGEHFSLFFTLESVWANDLWSFGGKCVVSNSSPSFLMPLSTNSLSLLFFLIRGSRAGVTLPPTRAQWTHSSVLQKVCLCPTEV